MDTMFMDLIMGGIKRLKYRHFIDHLDASIQVGRRLSLVFHLNKKNHRDGLVLA